MINEMQAKRQQQATSASPAPATLNATKSTPTPTAPTPSPAPAATLEAEIQRRVKNFRDNMVVALKKKTDQAEAVVDLAISRAQGLPNSGPIRGWEEADRLMVISVTEIIADARRAHNLQAHVPAPAAASQTPRQAPSASPAPTQPSTPATGVAQITVPNAPNWQSPQAASTSAARPAPSVSRPSVSIQRPTPLGIARPGVNSISRPSIMRKDSMSTPSTPGPSLAAPTHNVVSPAPPSAGVVDQIAGQKRQHSDAFATSSGASERPEPPKAPTPITATHLSTPVPPSAGAVDQIGQNKPEDGNSVGNGGVQYPESATKSITPVPATTPTPAPNMGSPAPPSAGVLDQIAGQKRHLDEGPGSTSSEQPEAKKPTLSLA